MSARTVPRTVPRSGSSSQQIETSSSVLPLRETEIAFIKARSSPRHLARRLRVNCSLCLESRSRAVHIPTAPPRSLSPPQKAKRKSFMQHELPQVSPTNSQTPDASASPDPTTQHGWLRHDSLEYGALPPAPLGQLAEDASVRPESAPLIASELGERLRRLSPGGDVHDQRDTTAGNRISEYENALMAKPTKSSQLGFKTLRHSGTPSRGTQLLDFPNEILTHVLSHLHPDSHGAVALVSRRFYALVTTPYAWRAAFLRHFLGHTSLAKKKTTTTTTTTTREKTRRDASEDQVEDRVRSEHRYFARLTPLASWRSEYLFRTRLLRGLVKGRPGNSAGSVGASGCPRRGKKTSAVLTYNSKLPWLITHADAAFVHGKKRPRVMHGAADLGVATMSDPATGRVEQWGLDDPFSFVQLDELLPDLEPFGLGDGPAAISNVMDVSQAYGMVGGEGFPGGRAYFRATDENRGRYLGRENAVVALAPEIPKIPELVEAVTSVWIAKSPSILTMTQSMVGIMTGSSLGVVTTYALGHDASGLRYSDGDVTARWILSPGVPIISLTLDDKYSPKRKFLKRVWAVALNALGEVYYLVAPPMAPVSRPKADDAIRHAWLVGRTVHWELVESTRRTARPKKAVCAAYSPRSPSNAMKLSKEQLVAEAQEIENFLGQEPSHFRRVCEGWDMRRRLEVDFANSDEDGTGGESIFVLDCGYDTGVSTGISRYTRVRMVAKPTRPPSSGTSSSLQTDKLGASVLAPPSGTPEPGPSMARYEQVEEWHLAKLVCESPTVTQITTSAMDLSNFAVMAAFEDPLCLGVREAGADGSSTPTSKSLTGEIPGRRARYLVVGTSAGTVIAWNAREMMTTGTISPVRVIQTESPSISCLAVSALFLVHGGSDGLVQAWDPLASTTDPLRTLNARSSGRMIPRHSVHANPALRLVTHPAVGAIVLDPDPAVLRGVLTCGLSVRFWTYSATSQALGRKRRTRHLDMHGRLASRREGGGVSGYIAAETAELRHEQQQRTRELQRLRTRFGIGFGDLTEEEAVLYAQMISEESFMQDEQRRTSASDSGDSGSAADRGDLTSCLGSTSGETVTPEPSVSGASANPLRRLVEDDEDDYEDPMQRAIRLSRLDGVNELGQSPRGHTFGSIGLQVKVKESKRGQRSGKRSSSSPASPAGGQLPTRMVQHGECSRGPGPPPAFFTSPSPRDEPADPDEDLELALQLSLVEEQSRQEGMARPQQVVMGPALGDGEEEYPALDVKGKGKMA